MNIGQGYKMTAVPISSKKIQDLSVPIHQLPRWVFYLALVLMIVPLIPFVIQYGLLHLLYGIGSWWVLIGFAVMTVLHEATHAIGWKIASGLPWSSFTFGFAWRGLAPYCHSKQPMNATAYRIGGILPLIFTGILPWLIGMATGDPALTFVGTMLITGAVGDIYVLWSLRHTPASAQVMDHESNAGCVVLLDA
jgi:hypothetical protein